MKAKLQPVYLPERNEREVREFETRLGQLKKLYAEEADFLEPVPIGEQPHEAADAVVFPQLIGSAFRQREAFDKINKPMIALTSSFGTVEMWDWEIVSFLREEVGCMVFTPYTVDLAKVILRALGCKNALRKEMRFLMFQDSPGEGMQSNIFKRFYWWEEQCTKQMEDVFGVKIVYRSYQELNAKAGVIPDDRAEAASEDWDIPMEGVPGQNYIKAVKLYLAVKDTLEEVGEVHGVGANCLNESFHSETTPCLAWNMLFERDHILWACEGDTVTLISKFIIYSALRRPVMMTNLYPFLVGMAALKHEKIEEFPDVPDPDNHALGVHCGYFGFAPRSFCSRWTLRPKVLEIVHDNALMVDCEMEQGPVTLAKIHPNMKKIIIIEARIDGYEKYPGSDCRNGALIHFSNNNGHQIMQTLCSHHALIIQGRCTHELLQLAQVFGFTSVVL